jgi:hypothetical protein
MGERVATLLAYGSFVLETSRLFVIYGDLECEDDNVVKIGMRIHIAFNPTFSVSKTIHSIEYILKDNVEYIGVCLKYEDLEELAFVSALNVGDETCEIYSA